MGLRRGNALNIWIIELHINTLHVPNETLHYAPNIAVDFFVATGVLSLPRVIKFAEVMIVDGKKNVCFAVAEGFRNQRFEMVFEGGTHSEEVSPMLMGEMAHSKNCLIKWPGAVNASKDNPYNNPPE
jgi:hypothetical protein